MIDRQAKWAIAAFVCAVGFIFAVAFYGYLSGGWELQP